MTRRGKIARLPKRVRDELNRRLDDGEQGKKLVIWLNGLPELQDVLKEDVGGRPITEQNLSEWKKGGFEDWKRTQESLDFASALSEEAAQIEQAASGEAMIDRLATVLTLSLGRVLRQLEPAAASSGRARRELLGIAEVLVCLRKSQQSAERLRMRRAWHDRELEAACAKDPTPLDEMKAAQFRSEMEPFRILSHELKRQRLLSYFQKAFGMEDDELLREFVNMPRPEATPASVSSPTESESIRLDPSP